MCETGVLINNLLLYEGVHQLTFKQKGLTLLSSSKVVFLALVVYRHMSMSLIMLD